MKEKVVLAYSGGLDTTAIIPWLKENFDYEVICVCVNCGQAEPYFLFRLKSATISVLRNAIRASIFLASTRAEMRKLWLLTALPLPV